MDRPNDATDQPVPLPQRLGLMTKILLLAAPLFLVLGALVAFTTLGARRIHIDLERVIEEERELELSKSLAAELIGAEAWAGRHSLDGASSAVVEDLVGHLNRAHRIVEGLAQGPGRRDPSEPAHEGREQSMLRELSRTLETSAQRAKSAADRPDLAGSLHIARRNAEILEAESKEEAHEAATDLDARTRNLTHTLYIVAGVCLATWLLLAISFHRLVIRPLRLLHEAATELGPPRGRAPVPVLSRDEFGQLTHAFNDMTERLAAHHDDLEQRVQERSRELIRTARLADLGTIAAGIAHEINNPLASIAAGVEGLSRELRDSDAVSRETLKHVELVISEAYRAKDIATRLLRFGRQENRRSEPVSLAQEAREVGSMLAFLAQQRGIEVAIGLDGGQEGGPGVDLPLIHSDPAEWRQVFFNVFRNALDAAPDHSTITVTGGREDGELVVTVRDEGPGFAPDQVDRVFEPFVTTKDAGSGTGLGLAIVDRIVHENGGVVEAANWENGGSIRIRLPWPTDTGTV